MKIAFRIPLRACSGLLAALLAVSGALLRAQAAAQELDATTKAIQSNLSAEALRHAAFKTKLFYTGKRFDLDQLPHYHPKDKISEAIRIWGLQYMGDCMLSQYWAEGFKTFHPGARIDYHLPTALVSTSGLVSGLCDIGANRRITYTELVQFEKVFRFHPLEIPLVTGSLDVPGWGEAMVVFVNQQNPVSKLTVDQLDGIFGGEREGGWDGTTWHPEYARGPEKNIRTWGQLGLTGDWQDRTIQVHGAPVRYDTATKFSDAVLRSGDKWNEKMKMIGAFVRPDGRIQGWSPRIAQAIAHDPGAIGYLNDEDRVDGIKALAIQPREGGPFAAPTLENLQRRRYPLFQANYWYIVRAPGAPIPPKVREFLTYVLSYEGQSEVVRDGKYLPLNAGLVRAALKSLE